MTDPCAKISKLPITRSIKIMGESQSFFLTFKKINNSLRKSIIIKIDY